MRRRAIAVGCAALFVIASCGDDKSNASAVATEPATTHQVDDNYLHNAADHIDVINDDEHVDIDVDNNPRRLHLPRRRRCRTRRARPPIPEQPSPSLQLGTIEIPKIGISKSIYEGITLTTLDHGPGHWPGTAMPGNLATWSLLDIASATTSRSATSTNWLKATTSS